MLIQRTTCFLFLFILLPSFLMAQKADISDAQIESADKNDPGLKKATSLLQSVVKEKTGIQFPLSKNKFQRKNPLIYLGTQNKPSILPQNVKAFLDTLRPTGKEGFKVLFSPDEKIIVIEGNDDRGVLYGAGYLLRKLEMRKGSVQVQEGLAISSTPAYPIRGHQMGYRPKTNAYDAWTIDQFDHYIRDLAIFGANSIEIVPPRTDDDASSPNMKLPAIQMISEQSRICEKYGLDCWMWYPNMGSDSDYIMPERMERELEERGKVFKVLPRLDALFVPGGDPGNLPPNILFSWLGKVAEVLQRYHPSAKIWVSPQGFRPAEGEFASFYTEVNKKYPWFGGVVYGPWIKESIRVVRSKVRKDIPIRRYPDITHSLLSQYPVPEWDVSYAITLDREAYNPRPKQEKYIHNLFASYGNGSISYSEGINDDVNKFVWSGQDWNPQTPVRETLQDYVRLFISPDYTEDIARGLLSLEENFNGPLLGNRQIQRTLQQWLDVEQRAPEDVLNDYRFQMGLLRAYFDAYIQRRLLHEKETEEKALDVLKSATLNDADESVRKAKNIFLKDTAFKQESLWRKNCFALSKALFQNIGSQTTAAPPQYAKEGRGNFMDNIDLPLNDLRWYISQLEQIEKLNSHNDKLKAIHQLLNRTNPGADGYYDNLGSSGSWKHVVRQKTWAEDPGGLESPFMDFGATLFGDDWVEIRAEGFDGRAIPLAWVTQITTLYDTPLKMRYENLDAKSRYKIRVAYTGRFNAHLRLVADDKFVIHDYLKTGVQPVYEFEIPEEATADGTLQLTWNCLPGERGTQVSEVWIIKER
jgi:hypothetical protein